MWGNFNYVILFPLGSEFVIERAEENGGRIAFRNYASLEETFARKVGLSSKTSVI